LEDLAPIHLALLLGTVHGVMADREPQVAHTFFLFVSESAGPVDLPLLVIDKHGLVRSQCVIAMLESLFIITDADVRCQMRVS
jgi:hypothetical protein